MSEKNNYKVLNKKEENRMASLEIEVDFSVLEKHRAKVIKKVGAHVEVKGFRKGAAPEAMIVEQVGEMKILEEMAYDAVVEILPSIVVDEKIEALTQPKISITKIAAGNPMVFKADFILMPEISLADYKKIAQSIKKEDVGKIEKKEIDDYIEYIRKSRADADLMKKKTSADKEEREAAAKIETPELPEFNDEFVKTLGNFKDVADFKKQLEENMQKDKEEKASQKRRLEIIEKIIAESKIDLPEIIIEEELQRMMGQFKHDIQHAKMNFDDYLKESKKTEADLMKEWRPDAIKRSKMNLILPKIALEEKIEADKEKVAHESKHLMQHYPDINEAQAAAYVSNMLRNDAVFTFLEEIK